MHVTTGTRWPQSLAIAAMLLGAAACSADPPPAGSVASSTPTLTSRSPTPTETPVAQQVEDAVRAYYAELTRAAAALDTTHLRTLTVPTCPCTRSADSIDRVRKNSHAIPDASWIVEKVHIHDIIAQSAGAEVWYRVAKYNILDGNGQVISRLPKRDKHVDLSLLNRGTSWRISNVFDLGG